MRRAGLKEPELIQEEEFKTILWRKVQVIEQVTEQVQRLLLVMGKAISGLEIMKRLELKHRPTFLHTHLQPALEGQWIEMAIPDKPNAPNQKYRLTAKGKILQQQLKRKK